MPGLLIVNADDLGGNRLATDRIVECFSLGVITSASGMVGMSDSVRAAAAAGGAGIPVGLHLNVTQPYDSAQVPASAVARQARLTAFLADPLRRRIGFAPWLVPTARRVIGDQLERFRELYGREPTHVDGHNHAHLNPTVLAALPRGLAVRPAHDSGAGVRSRVTGTLPRQLRRAILSRRHRTVAHFFPLTEIDPELGGAGLELALTIARGSPIEIMVHPDRDEVFALLRGERWASALAQAVADGAALGSYADLSAPSPFSGPEIGAPSR